MGRANGHHDGGSNGQASQVVGAPTLGPRDDAQDEEPQSLKVVVRGRSESPWTPLGPNGTHGEERQSTKVVGRGRGVSPWTEAYLENEAAGSTAELPGSTGYVSFPSQPARFLLGEKYPGGENDLCVRRAKNVPTFSSPAARDEGPKIFFACWAVRSAP